VWFCFFQSTSGTSNVFSSFVDSTAGKLLSLFGSEKEKLSPSPLVIPIDDTLRPDVFPLVDCSPGDSEVEVVHVRGVKKGRRCGRTTNSESSDVNSVGKPSSSVESGYRSVPEGVTSTPVVSSDVSNDSLTSVCSCPSSSVITSPPPVSLCSTYSGDCKGIDIRVEVLTECPTKTPSIVTRTTAEDELIRSILEDHCKSLCHPAVVISSSPSSGSGSKSVFPNADIPTSTTDINETARFADQYPLVDENTEVKLDVTRTLDEESDPGELENVAPNVDTGETVRVLKPSVAEDEISIYDDAGLALQSASVHDLAEESAFSSGLTSMVDDQQQPGNVEPVSWLLPADTDSMLSSDTKFSRTSSVSSSLSLESLAHSAEVRCVTKPQDFIIEYVLR